MRHFAKYALFYFFYALFYSQLFFIIFPQKIFNYIFLTGSFPIFHPILSSCLNVLNVITENYDSIATTNSFNLQFFLLQANKRGKFFQWEFFQFSCCERKRRKKMCERMWCGQQQCMWCGSMNDVLFVYIEYFAEKLREQK